MEFTPDGSGKADNDSLADMAAVEVLHTLTTPIQGQASVTIHNYRNARRIVKAALLAVFNERIGGALTTKGSDDE